LPLGLKDHSLPGNGIDASARDSAINIANWPVFGMYEPDAIAAYQVRGQTYLVMANEGDAREYGPFAEEARVSSLNLDPTEVPNATFLKNNSRLGRLTVSTASADTDGDGDADCLSVLGSRSFSIRDPQGNLVFDSGDAFEQIVAQTYPVNSNSDNEANDFDSRSDNKGPEPEALALGEIKGRTYAFIGLERISGIMVYNITNPQAPKFIQFINNRDFSSDPEAGTADDLGPEGIDFIPASHSPLGTPILAVANEIRGTTTLYTIEIN
jgi:hypothetical protein